MKILLLTFIISNSLVIDTAMANKVSKKNIDELSKIDDMAQLLAIDLAPFIMENKRDIVVFNYRKKSLVGLKDLNTDYTVNNPEALNYVTEWTNTVKKFVPQETGFLGWGFYTSNNPDSSTDFAESESGEFALIRQTFPKSSRILDIRHSGELNLFPISNNTLDKIKSVCKFYGFKGSGKEGIDGYGRFQKNSIGKDPICKEIFTKALEKLNVTAILYSWREDDSNICDSTEQSSAAFVSFNPEISEKTVELVTNSTQKIIDEANSIAKNPDKNVKKYSLGERTFNTYAKTAVHLESYENNQFLSKVAAFITQNQKEKEKIREEIRKETFGCSKKHPEDHKLTFNPENISKYGLIKDPTKLFKSINTKSIEPCGSLEISL